ncbi:DNA-binding transcriptional regulator, AcrR family [Prauserella marina]|uniref:DNA-binding transcriptional regulator, AcrR family n=1 Tax=Prauserella marina TaxID=530584 RepID=A0A1G6R4E4_9PSEU|nr:TetR/AcrR family transcriptional regulator [Prauserella marina]PWV76844.1 TetR family transcriptional regulator [Prauserella marina]SDC98867.1 DNA-binding transcriptional regulator, AcrR family [Prauserella marina]
MIQQRDAVAETGARARTRKAILDAAVSVLSKDSTASLGEIAAEAGVGRTTMHRYFPERSDLLTAIGAEALGKVAVATERAKVDEGTAAEALERLALELFDLGDLLMLAFNDPGLTNSPDWETETEADQATARLLDRIRVEGGDPELDADWLVQVLWSVLYAAWTHTRENGVPRQQALRLCLRTLRNATGLGGA